MKELFIQKSFNLKIPSEINLLLYSASLLLPLFLYFIWPTIKLSWLGKRIVSYAKSISYLLTKSSLNKLAEEKVPEEILKKLNDLKYTRFWTEDKFTEAVVEKIKSEQFEVYKELILKHGKHSES